MLFLIQTGVRNPWLDGIRQRLTPRWRPVVASVAHSGQLQADMRGQRVASHSLGAERRSAQLVAVFKLWRLLRREQVDLVHALSFDADLITLAACSLARVPWVYSYTHQPHFFRSLPTNAVKKAMLIWLDRQIAGRADAIVSQSSPVRRALEADGVPPGRIRDIPIGFDIEALRQRAVDRERLRDELGLGARPSAVCVARLSWEKNHERLLYGWAEVVADHPRARLVLVGEGPLGGRLRRVVADLDLVENVTFAGHRTDVPSVMLAVDMVVHFATHESFGQVIAEALALGCAVITSPAGIGADLIDGEECLVVDPADPTTLRSAVSRLVDEPGLADRIRTGGAKRAEAQFTIDANVRAFEAMYEEVLASTVRS